MNNDTIIQFVTLVVYLGLIVVALRYTRARLRILFLVYLVASAGWSLSSYLAHADFASMSSVWFKLIPFAASWTIIAYAHFVGTFVKKGARPIAMLGYGSLFVITILIALGYIPRDTLNMGDGTLYNDYGPWLYFLTFIGACFTGTAVFLLVKSYRASVNPQHRNRILYLLVGVVFLAIFGSLFEVLPEQTYALDHIGHLGNALMITYAILRYQLLDIKLVARKGLVYSGITVAITALYLVMLTILQYFLHGWTTSASLVSIAGVAILMAWLFNPLRTVVQKVVDKLFYGERYDYRQMVLSFARRMSNVIELGELAGAMLRPITKAVRASQVSLLLPSEGDFNSQFAERLVEDEPVIQVKFRKEGPIVAWLAREDKPLPRELIDINPEFKGLWEAERKNLEAAEVRLLCPIKSKQTLVGILALSKKPRGLYSADDSNMLMTLAHEAAVAIENAQLYAQAKQRANTDELTGLFNHRYLHQRLDEEISRCSRFGEIFSLLFLDLDLFKAYNDIYGHLAGDEILKQVSQHIKNSIRSIDIGFRYGGDEFAVILPQTSLDGASRVAGRIRRGIEVQMDTKGVPLTCSIGIASWPTDGVMREELIRAVDAALYYAKQTGRNRLCLASEVALSQVLKMEVGSEHKTAILDTIYALAATVDAKDHHTYGHSKKVSQYATDIAQALGYSEDGIATIRAAGLLHDIGKIGISDQLLEKPGSLSPDEWEAIRAHPNLGVAILKHVDSLKDCLAAVQYHHERYDGTGYPAGLKGENIPIDARILAVADAYDAMTSLRPYRQEKSTPEQALEELKRCAGTQFDSKIVDAFARLNGWPTLEEIGASRT